MSVPSTSFDCELLVHETDDKLPLKTQESTNKDVTEIDNLNIGDYILYLNFSP